MTRKRLRALKKHRRQVKNELRRRRQLRRIASVTKRLLGEHIEPRFVGGEMDWWIA